MSTPSLTPADRFAQTAGMIRQLLGAWLLVGFLFAMVVLFVELPSFVEYLILSSTVPVGAVSVFIWRAYPAYKESVQ